MKEITTKDVVMGATTLALFTAFFFSLFLFALGLMTLFTFTFMFIGGAAIMVRVRMVQESEGA